MIKTVTGEGNSSVVERKLSMHTVLGSFPCTSIKNKKKTYHNEHSVPTPLEEMLVQKLHPGNLKNSLPCFLT